MRQPHAAANQLRAAKTDRIGPDFFQELRGITRYRQRRIAGFLGRQRLETFRKGIPQFLYVSQTLLAGGRGIANPQMPRQAAEVQQQVADSRANIKTDRAVIPELGIDRFQAALGDKNRAAVDIAVQKRFGLREETVLQRGNSNFQLIVTAQRGDVSFQFSRIIIALVNLIRVVEEQVFGDLAHFRVNVFCDLRFFSMRMQIKIAGVEQRMRQIFTQLT
ncbi:hypothetical protein D3C78_832650 [compost metagenome]